MSFPRYERYKESGVEWLGEVPEGWEVAPLKRHFGITGGSTPKSDQEAYWDGDIVWVTPSDLSKLQSLYIGDSQRKITANGLASCGASLVPTNSIILSTRAPIGSLAITNSEMCTNQGCKSLVPGDSADAKFYGYLLSNSSTELNIRGKGTTFLELSGDELGAFKVPFPPLPEQHTIAAFLDRETGKIDELVAEQERLIALLKEKRQATISHAVTKGLNPDAPMKDSGIEWLGEVPLGWEVVTAKRVTGIFVPQRNKPVLNTEADGEYWVTMEQMRNEEITTSDLWVSEAAARDAGTRVLKVGAVIASCVGTFGLAAINKVDVIINQQLQAFIPTKQIDARFLVYCVIISKGYFESIGTAATISYVNQSGFENLPLVLPEIKEQSAIVAFLDSETAKIDALVSEAQQAIGLLKERRSALISAAVTGKIDVRNSDRSDKTDLSEDFPDECDLENALTQTRIDLAKSNFVKGSAEEHITRLKAML